MESSRGGSQWAIARFREMVSHGGALALDGDDAVCGIGNRSNRGGDDGDDFRSDGIVGNRWRDF